MQARQEPTYSWCAEYGKTEGKFAAAVADAYGLSPHPWQRRLLDDWLALDGDGKLLNKLCVLPVPRQNGKTGVCDPRETWGLIQRGEWILHTAQEYQTAKKAFDRLRVKFGECKNDPHAKYPELNRLVDRYTTSANQMVLDLTNGAHIEFRTRGSSGDMGRGGTFDLVVVDEAQCYTEAQDSALSPLNSAAPSGSPQTILMGTVPEPGSYKGAKFYAIRKRLHDEPYVGACIHEWGASEIGNVEDVSRWYEFNPSLGFQLLESALYKDVMTMAPDTFAREHLGWWSPTAGLPTMALDGGKWEGLSTDNPPSDGKTAYGVRFAPDGSEVCLCAALKHEGGVHVEVVRRENTSAGLTWLADFISERHGSACCCVIDGKSGVQALVDRLERMPKGYLHVASAQDAVAAAATLLDCVNEKTLTWYAPQEDLRDSAVTSIRRNIGNNGSWGFGGENPTPITAASLAVWGAMTARRDPRRKGIVG
ncbi:MAG: hypothetical protein IJ087_10130 [Eggerthellaceae bacterium]|nr:hypothetical protein [Eggerthellaceae bacterium]